MCFTIRAHALACRITERLMDEHPQYILHFMSLCYIMLLTLFAFNPTSTHMASVKGAFLFIRIITIYLFNLSSFLLLFNTSIHLFSSAYHYLGCGEAGDYPTIGREAGYTQDRSPSCRRANTDRQAPISTHIQTYWQFRNHQTPLTACL